MQLLGGLLHLDKYICLHLCKKDECRVMRVIKVIHQTKQVHFLVFRRSLLCVFVCLIIRTGQMCCNHTAASAIEVVFDFK